MNPKNHSWLTYKVAKIHKPNMGKGPLPARKNPMHGGPPAIRRTCAVLPGCYKVFSTK